MLSLRVERKGRRGKSVTLLLGTPDRQRADICRALRKELKAATELSEAEIDLDRLKFPSGVAVATILKTGSSGISKFKLLVTGVAISALWKLIMESNGPTSTSGPTSYW